MYRFIKFIGILIVLGIVSFLICDEKGVKINTDNGYIVFQQEKTFIPIYKADSKLVHFYSGFEDFSVLSSGTTKTYNKSTKYVSFYKGFKNSEILRLSNGIDTGISGLITKANAEQNNDSDFYFTGGNGGIKSDNTKHLVKIDENNSVSDVVHPYVAIEKYNLKKNNQALNKAIDPKLLPQEYTGYIEDTYAKPENNSGDFVATEYTGEILTGISDSNTGLNIQILSEDLPDDILSNESGTDIVVETGNNDLVSNVCIDSKECEKSLTGNTKDSVDLWEKSGDENNTGEDNILDENHFSVEKYQYKKQFNILEKGKEIIRPTVSVDKYEIVKSENLLQAGVEIEIPHRAVNRYFYIQHYLPLNKGTQGSIEIIDDNQNGISSSDLESILQDEEIDVDSLESENDEFLEKIFAKNKDPEIMNLIIENYLNEYQFTRAKKFIERLPESSYSDLDPLLNLRVVFNSFSLTSQSIATTLTELVNSYQNQISSDDINRYLGIIAIMQKDYDKFFEISNNFKSEKYKNFTAKIQSLKEQTSKEMGIPDYYLDTLIAVELFNQGLFQPSKVIAISSLSQDSNYILPYQLLGYANFLTNSWDTAIEYFKKLIDLDPNNAEKYRFLMGVAYYRGEKYEQSVVMLSMINEGKLRLDAERYLIRDYLILGQENKLISSRGKLLGYDDLTPSDFYTYFYEVFYHPYAEGADFNLYAYDTGLGEKMLRVCNLVLSEEERGVCEYGNIGKNIALGEFDGLEQSLLSLIGKYPQGYLYHALGEYYIKNGDIETAKTYLLKAVSLTQTQQEKSQIKKLLEDTIQ